MEFRSVPLRVEDYTSSVSKKKMCSLNSSPQLYISWVAKLFFRSWGSKPWVVINRLRNYLTSLRYRLFSMSSMLLRAEKYF